MRIALLGIGLMLQLACFTYAANRSGLVAMIGAVALFGLLLVLFRLWNWKYALLTFLLLTVAGGLLAPDNWRQRFATLGSTENIDVYSRVVFLETGAAMVLDDPLLGKGIGQFVVYYPYYKTAKHWEKFPLLPPDITMWAQIPKQAHNEFLQVLIELGVLGFVLFAAFWIMLGRSAFRRLCVARFWLRMGDMEERLIFCLTAGAVSGLAGVLANSLLTFPLQTVTSGLMTWTVAGVVLAMCGCREITIKLFRRD